MTLSLRRHAAALGIAALLVYPHISAAAGAAVNATMMSSMAKMDAAMARAPMTGDIDRDFIAMMLPHHRGAVEMATEELARGHDARLRRLAQEIVVTQEAEIQVMRSVRHDLAARSRSKAAK